MLLFYPADARSLSRLQREGTPAGATFFSSLEEAREGREGPVLVVDAEAHPSLRDSLEDAPALPAAAFENLQPYHPPEPVTAGGGYVLHTEGRGHSLQGRSLLLIYRRGVWDLPKGKKDPGESVRACAIREVREETGLDEVRSLGVLGPTVHGYHEELADGPRYCVKTTHWFLMETPEADLTPEHQEGIEEAAWVAWEKAGEKLGYETLRRHHRRAGERALAILQERKKA